MDSIYQQYREELSDENCRFIGFRLKYDRHGDGPYFWTKLWNKPVFRVKAISVPA